MGTVTKLDDKKAKKDRWEQLMAPLRKLGLAHLVNTPSRAPEPKVKVKKAPESSEPRTSASHPIRVDWVPGVEGLAGRFGATFCPGKTQKYGRDGKRWQRDLYVDLERVRKEFHADVLVSLLEGWEFSDLNVDHLVPMAEHVGLRSYWMPIQDGNIPRTPNLFVAFVEKIYKQAQQGKNVVVHCRGGIGRTGTLISCCLIIHGLAPEAAILKTREARPNAVENPLQIKFVWDFAEHWAKKQAQRAEKKDGVHV